MQNQNQTEQLDSLPIELLGVFALNIIIILITLVIFRYYWVKQIGISFPIFLDNNEEEKTPPISSLAEALYFNAEKLYQFD